MKGRPVLVIALTAVLMLSACNLPVAPRITPTPAAGNVLTAAAETAAVMATVQAGTAQAVVIATSTPEIHTPTATQPGPADTPTQTRVPPTNTPQPCDAAGFISDVSIPDGTKMAPGEAFTKTWRLRNNGTCSWNRNYALIFASGESMGAPAVVSLPGDVPPNSTVDVSIEMKAPMAPGRYTGNWRLRNPSGVIFGVEGNTPFYVIIEVVGTTTPTHTVTPTGTTATPTGTATPTQQAGAGVIYDLAANACKAEWRTATGALACPGTLGDEKGAAAVVPSPTVETGSVESQIVLLTQPEGVENGAIAGIFPALAIQDNYRFRATLGCLGGQTACSVKYQLNYREGTGSPVNLGQWSQTYDGMIQGIDVDLSALAGKEIQLILVVLADGPSTQDAALWIYPRVTKG